MRCRDLMLHKLHLNEDDALHPLNALLKSNRETRCCTCPHNASTDRSLDCGTRPTRPLRFDALNRWETAETDLARIILKLFYLSPRTIPPVKKQQTNLSNHCVDESIVDASPASLLPDLRSACYSRHPVSANTNEG